MAGLGATALSVSNSSFLSASEPHESSNKTKDEIRLGIASYTFREFDLDQTIAMTKLLGLKYIALKSFHLPMDSTEQETKSAASFDYNEGEASVWVCDGTSAIEVSGAAIKFNSVTDNSSPNNSIVVSGSKLVFKDNTGQNHNLN